MVDTRNPAGGGEDYTRRPLPQSFDVAQTVSSGAAPIDAVSARTPRVPNGIKYRLIKATAQGIPVSATYTPRFKLYKGLVNLGNMIGGSRDGEVYESQPLDIILNAGDFLTFQWIATDTAITFTGVAVYEILPR
jgi:hypothetical protein